MKKFCLIIIMLLIVSVLIGCDENAVVVPTPIIPASSSSSSYSSSTSFSSIAVTQLTIKNQVSLLHGWIDLVYCAGKYFGDDRVFDHILSICIDGINPGSSSTRTVSPGNYHIYFWLAIGGPQYITVNGFTITEGQHKTFSFYDSTLVTEPNSYIWISMSDLIDTFYFCPPLEF